MPFEWKTYAREHPRFGGYYRAVESRPWWVTRTAFIAASLTVIVPLIALVIAAVVVGFVVFFVLGFFAMIAKGIEDLFGGGKRASTPPEQPAARPTPRPSSPGRDNVRVIRD